MDTLSFMLGVITGVCGMAVVAAIVSLLEHRSKFGKSINKPRGGVYPSKPEPTKAPITRGKPPAGGSGGKPPTTHVVIDNTDEIAEKIHKFASEDACRAILRP